MRSQVRILPGAPFSCKNGHSFASARCSRNDGPLQRLAAYQRLLIFDNDLVDQKPDISLA